MLDHLSERQKSANSSFMKDHNLSIKTPLLLNLNRTEDLEAYYPTDLKYTSIGILSINEPENVAVGCLRRTGRRIDKLDRHLSE